MSGLESGLESCLERSGQLSGQIWVRAPAWQVSVHLHLNLHSSTVRLEDILNPASTREHGEDAEPTVEISVCELWYAHISLTSVRREISG